MQQGYLDWVAVGAAGGAENEVEEVETGQRVVRVIMHATVAAEEREIVRLSKPWSANG